MTETGTKKSNSTMKKSDDQIKTIKTTKSIEDPSRLALKQFVNDDRHFSLVRNFRLADVITILNGVCGSLSIFSSSLFLITLDLDHLKRACLLPILSLAFDFLDGKVARYRNESSVLGQELDSLADLISFGVAPALIGFCIGLRHPIDIALLTLFICAGLTRLARFNSTASFKQSEAYKQQAHQTKPNNRFEGLPIPTSLWLVTGMYECIRRSEIELPVDDRILKVLIDNLSHSKVQSLKIIQENGNRLRGGLIENSWGIKVHWISLIFGLWAFLMLSKTLKAIQLK